MTLPSDTTLNLDPFLCLEALDNYSDSLVSDLEARTLSTPHPEDSGVSEQLEFLSPLLPPLNGPEHDDWLSCMYGRDWKEVDQDDTLCPRPAERLLEGVAVLLAAEQQQQQQQKREWVQGLEDVEGGSPLKRLRLSGRTEHEHEEAVRGEDFLVQLA